MFDRYGALLSLKEQGSLLPINYRRLLKTQDLEKNGNKAPGNRKDSNVAICTAKICELIASSSTQAKMFNRTCTDLDYKTPIYTMAHRRTSS